MKSMVKRSYNDITITPEANRIKPQRLGFLLLIVAPITFAISNEHQHYCGKTWPDAFDNCYKPCPTQSDTECSSLGNGVDDAEWKCFGYTGCVDKLGGGVEDSSAVTAPEQGSVETISSTGDSDSYCGASWTEAMASCKVACPSGDNTECPNGHQCYAAANCAVPLITVTSQLVVSMLGPDSTMDYTDQGIFGNTLNDFISDAAGGEGGLNMKGVSLGQQSLSGRRLIANVTGVYHRKLPIGSSALDVSVTVTGEYRPPPYLDLDVICQDSINRDPQRVVGTLQERGNQQGRTFFQRVEGIEAIPRDAFTKRPTRTPTNRPTTKNPTSAPTGKPVTMTPTISPTSTPSDFPSLQPSDFPSSEPTRSLIQYISTGSDELLAVGGDTTSSFGYLFNIRTKPDGPAVIIKALEYFTKSTQKMKFELWTRLGSFKDFKGSLNGWENIAKGSVAGRGPGQYTSIPPDKFIPVDIPGGGGTRAFYLTLRTKDLVYSYGEGSESDGSIQVDTPDLELWEGEGVLLFPMPDASESMYYRWPRRFLGSIYYDRLPCRPYSAYGIIQELPCPDLPTQSPTEPQPTLSPVTPAPTPEPITPIPTFKPTTSPTLRSDETSVPSFTTPAPQMGISSPTVSPTVSRVPSSAPSSSYPTLSPLVRMQAGLVVTLHNVPEREMEEREMIVFTETTQEFLQRYTEQTLILDAIDIWHQQMVEVNAIPFDMQDEYDSIINNITVDVGSNITQNVNASEAIVPDDISSSAGGFANNGNEDKDDEMASGFADFDANDSAADAMAGGFVGLGTASSDTDGAMAGGFVDNSEEDTSDAMAGGFIGFGSVDPGTNEAAAGGFVDNSEENSSDAMAGGFVGFNSRRKHDFGLRKLKPGGGSGSNSGPIGLDQDKLDKIIAFKQKHSDRGPKTAGVQVTLILRIPFAFIPEDLLGKYAAVVTQEHGMELVHSLRKQSSFYSYFKDLSSISSDAVEELTPPPTNMPTSYAQFLSLKQQEQTFATQTDGRFATMVWVSLLLFWFFLTGVSVCCLFRARMQMKERLKMEALLSQEKSSSKPLIKQNRPDTSYDSWQSKSSTEDEEETVSSFGASILSKSSVDDKSCVTKATRHTFSGGFASTDNDDVSKVSKHNRKTMFALDTKSLASSEDDLLDNSQDVSSVKQKRKTLSAIDAKSSLSASKTMPSSTSSEDDLHDNSQDMSSAKQKRKTLSAIDAKSSLSASKTKPTSTSSEDDLLGNSQDVNSVKQKRKTISVIDAKSSLSASKTKPSSSRNLEADDCEDSTASPSTTRSRRQTVATSRQSMAKAKSGSDRNLQANSAESNTSSSRQKRSTVAVVNSRRSTMSKSKTGSDRKLETNMEALSNMNENSESKASSRQNRKTAAGRSSMSKSSSSSSRNLKANELDINDLFGIPSDGQSKSHSRQHTSSGRRRHTTVDQKAMMSKLSSFDIV